MLMIELAKEAVDRIGYKVERDIKELGLKANEISGYRKRHALPQLNDRLDWCKKLRDKTISSAKDWSIAEVQVVRGCLLCDQSLGWANGILRA